jgi:hypothetical protein
MLSHGILLQLSVKAFGRSFSVAPSTAFTIKNTPDATKWPRANIGILPPPFFQKAKSRVPVMQSIAAERCCAADHVQVLLINYVKKTHTALLLKMDRESFPRATLHSLV